MSILYSYDHERYLSTEEMLTRGKTAFPKCIYVNLTNRCPCDCSFCIRYAGTGKEFDDLWLPKEPTLEEILREFDRISHYDYREVIFCGYGEPLVRLEEVIAIAGYLKIKKNVKIRVNTNGLGNLIHQRNIVPQLVEAIDSISISLNASNEEEYLKITNSSFGNGSFQSLLEFAGECNRLVPEVRLTIVDIIGPEEVERCRHLCQLRGLKLAVRSYRE